MQNLNRIMAVILVCAALLFGLFAWMLARRPPPVRASAPVAAQASFPVVVTLRPLPAGKPIAPDALRVERLPMQPAPNRGSWVSLCPRARNSPLRWACGLKTSTAPSIRSFSMKGISSRRRAPASMRE